MNRSEKAVLSMIGLATKAGKTITGNDACMTAIKRDKVRLILIATDASQKTKDPIINLCSHYDTVCKEFSTRDELGNFTGKNNRAMVAITDDGFAKRILELTEVESSD
jgi:ribosomal protein L7Ae-like RNA K-turn-binding protein